MHSGGMPGIYFRFNVEQGMQAVMLAEWEKLEEMTAHTEQYSRAVEMDQILDDAVLALQAVGGAAQIGMKFVSAVTHDLTHLVAIPRWCHPFFFRFTTGSENLSFSNACPHRQAKYSLPN